MARSRFVLNDGFYLLIFYRYTLFWTVQVVMDKHTRRSKGYAFVSYRFGEDSTRALGAYRFAIVSNDKKSGWRQTYCKPLYHAAAASGLGEQHPLPFLNRAPQRDKHTGFGICQGAAPLVRQMPALGHCSSRVRASDVVAAVIAAPNAPFPALPQATAAARKWHPLPLRRVSGQPCRRAMT